MARGRGRSLVAVALLVAALTACAQAPARQQTAAGPAPAAPSAPDPAKRITLAVMMDPPQLMSKFDRLLPGATDMEVLVAAGLAIPDDHGVWQPLLAETVPSVENGLWTLGADGTMDTTWKLRPGLRWHDGTPFTADDVVFTSTLGRDPDLPFFRHPGFDLVDGVEAVDPQTVVVHWRAPYVAADTLFSVTLDISRITIPMPKHLLEAPYLADKQSFSQLPYWTDDFVGTGPFRLREWVQGSHAILDAFDGFALGAPRVGTVEVRFIPDGNTLVANVLAGTVDASMGRGLSLDQAVEVEKQWHDGRMFNGGPGAWFAVFGQFINPDPAIITNVAFRRALAHSLDRQAMADALMYGRVPVADTLMSPAAAEYDAIAPSLVRYDYSPTRATELLQGLGLAAGPDGTMRDAEGRPVSLEIRTTPGDLMVKTNETVADQWRRLGFPVQTVTFSQTQQRDLEYRATRPAFELSRRGTGMENLAMFHSRELPLPENRYAGKNLPRYSDPELDGLIDRYYATVPKRERTDAVAQTLRFISDQLPVTTLFYDTEPSLVSNRLVNLNPKPAESTAAWNAYLWDVR